MVAFGTALSAMGCAAEAADAEPISEDDAAIVAAPGAIKLPTKLTCTLTVDGQRAPGSAAGGPSSRSDQEKNVIYTRLAKIRNRSQLSANAVSVWGQGSTSREGPKKDEIADGWRGDYFSADITASEFHYNLWTCDSEDRAYSFKTDDLALPATSKVKTKDVAGKVNISVRSDGADYALSCVAQY